MLFYLKNHKALLVLTPIFFYFNYYPIFQNTELLGLLDLTDITMICLSFLLIQNVRVNTSDKLLSKYKKAVMFYIILCLLINVFLLWKRHFIIENTYDLLNMITRSLKFSLYTFTLYAIFQRINSRGMLKTSETALIVFVFVFTISAMLYKPLLSMGIDIGVRMGNEDIRNAGIFNNNEIVFANTLGMIFGYFIGKLEHTKFKLIHIIIILLILIGIIFSASRGGFIGILLIFVLFLIRKRTSKIGVSLLLLIFSILVLYFGGDILLDRLLMRSLEFEGSYTDITNKYGGLNVRIFKWVNYINELIKNPSYLFFGTNEETPFYYNPHNVLIFILFFGGIIPFICYLVSMGKLFFLSRSRNQESFNKLYILIPFGIMVMELNQWFYFMLPILIMMSYGYKKEMPVSQNIK